MQDPNCQGIVTVRILHAQIDVCEAQEHLDITFFVCYSNIDSYNKGR